MRFQSSTSLRIAAGLLALICVSGVSAQFSPVSPGASEDLPLGTATKDYRLEAVPILDEGDPAGVQGPSGNPVPVPESGSSILLLATGLGLLAVSFHRRRRHG